MEMETAISWKKGSLGGWLAFSSVEYIVTYVKSTSSGMHINMSTATK